MLSKRPQAQADLCKEWKFQAGVGFDEVDEILRSQTTK